MADAATADELLLAIDQAIDEKLAANSAAENEEEEDAPQKHQTGPLTEWADSPTHETTSEPAGEFEAGKADLWAEDDAAAELATDEVENGTNQGDNISNFTDQLGTSPNDLDGPDADLPTPDFGQFQLDDPEVDEFGEEIEEGDESAEAPSYSFASLTDYIEVPSKKAVDLEAERFDPEDYKVEEPVDQTGNDEGSEEIGVSPPEQADAEPSEDVSAQAETSEILALGVTADDPTARELEAPEMADLLMLDADAGLHDCLASARELAHSARASEDRSRQALYAAVGRAYDVSLAAKDEPEAFNELIEDNGLTVQERAPMTPVVKLVFGQDYDKTRLTEYAAVLTHAHRLDLERGSLADFLGKAEGGLKAVVASERRLRREEAGQVVEDEGDVRAKLAKKLRELEALMFDAISAEGPEFSLVMVRRDGEGNVAMIGEIDDDVALIERAGKKLVG
ncbi:MAG: hypothetical protein ABJ205_08845 [Erythrobacter sp.]|uniref:hypothetical protein n=1 Tax=Erythrobacter sp. TaxID=1042 RepID=UPI003264B541